MNKGVKFVKVSAEKRRKISNKKIKKLGIACLETLPVIEDSSQVKLKSLDVICKRAIASLISIQVAFTIANGEDFNEAKPFFENLLERYSVQDALLENEKKVLNNEASEKEILNITWNYEAYWSLVWALGLVDDIEYPYSICDCDLAINLVVGCKNLEEFKSKCKIRDIEKILDMVDLYYRYHWAVVEKQWANPDTNIGDLNSEVVFERRKGLEWLISSEDDWDEISLDT